MANDHADIRRHFDGFAAALHAKDLERVMAHYAPKALAFDLLLFLGEVGPGLFREALLHKTDPASKLPRLTAEGQHAWRGPDHIAQDAPGLLVRGSEGAR